MLLKPRFRASFDVHVAGRAVFLLDEHRQLILEGERYCILAPLLDGVRSISDIARDCEQRLPLPQIFSTLNELERRGYLVEGGDSAAGPAAQAFWEYPREGGPAKRAPHELAVSVQGLGRASALPLSEAFLANGIALDQARSQLLVVATDDYLRGELEEINRTCLRENRPWMLFKPVGLVLWIGPIFEPNKTGCWHCLRQRLEANRMAEQYIQDHTSPQKPVVTSVATLPASLELASSLAVTAATEWLAFPESARLRGRMMSLDLANTAAQHHELVRRPQCTECGNPDLMRNRGMQSIALGKQLKHFQEDGGHRTHTPEQTFEKYQHHISPYLGAVTMLLPALGAWNELTPNFVAGHNFSMGLDDVALLRESIRGLSGGKGASIAQAKASALCEALERYSGRYHHDEYTRRGTLVNLQPDAIHPNECMGFSSEQFEMRAEWNAKRAMGSRCELICQPFDRNREIDWSPLWSLTANKLKYLPTAYCYYGHPEFSEQRWCAPDSNGTAAGNTLEEAILQGFFELVERDAVALWFYNRIKRRGVDIESFGLPYLKAIQKYYVSLKRDIWVLDVTSDLGIATFACISRRIDKPVEDILLGFGSHFDPKIAMLRAVTEVNQFLPSISLARPDGSTRYTFGDALSKHWWTTARLENNEYLSPDPEKPAISLGEFENPSSQDLLEDVEHCIELCRRKGFEMLVLDQTRPDIGLNVVKVVVPELCHFWRRLGKRRLYETPVAMGWLNRPRSFEELNPYSIFF
ncbi:MAG TPA: TOMM precursor leader peptide-binding protein [Terriglobia bacterium]